MCRVSREASPNNCPSRITLRDCRKAVCLLGVALLVLLSGCGRAQQANPTSNDDFTVALTTDPAPPVAADGTVIVTLHDAAGRSVDNAQLALEANMSHAGMTPVNAAGARGEDGVYRVPLTWTMAGDWVVDVRFTLPDGQKITRRFPVNVLAR